MILTRWDKLAYWSFWFLGHASGLHAYDWTQDWNYYLGLRRRGLTPWQAYTAEG